MRKGDYRPRRAPAAKPASAAAQKPHVSVTATAGERRAALKEAKGWRTLNKELRGHC